MHYRRSFVRRSFVWAIMIVGVLAWGSEGRGQSIAEYTSVPNFVTNTVPPNVLLVLDNSGSMNEMAYVDPFDRNRKYGGIFNSFECYTYGSNKFQYDPALNPTVLGTCPSSYPWSGNLLNYVSMRRVDIAKWVMMGGICQAGGRDAMGGCLQLIGQHQFAGFVCCKDQTQAITVTDVSGLMPASRIPPSGNVYFHLMGSVSALQGKFCVDNDPTQQTTSDCSDGGSYTETVWDITVDIAENATGVIQNVGTKARFGLMEFKGVGDGGKVLSDVGGNLQNMITAIEASIPSTWTPLAESLYEATRYFAQVRPAYTNSDYSYTVTLRDPYFFTQPQWAGTSQYANCCKSFVILFTDGESTQDQNIPSGLQNHAVPINGPLCTGAGCSNHRTDYPSSGSHYLDDVAYWAHTTDLRQATLPVLSEAGKPLDGTQSLTVYTFFAFGSGSDLLQDAAKVGGFQDRNGNNVPDLTEEWDRVNNITGALGPDGVPDTYFESDDAFKLRERLMATITSILQRAASGTSVSVLATSATGDGALFQSFFFPSLFEGLSEVNWTGYTQALFLDFLGNIREDTNGDGRLVLSQDNIVKTRFDPADNDVKVDRFADADGDGKADSTTPFESVGLREVKPIWEAGKQLAVTDPTNRKVLTWVDRDDDGIVDGGEVLDFTTANAATLGPYLRADATAPFTAANLIEFLRGTQVSGLRDRLITVNGSQQVWKLGDPVHATPVAVGAPRERYDVIYGDASYVDFFRQYRNRRQVAYVGANDGMLHAFNAGFYHRGDDLSTTTVVERGHFTRTPTDNSRGPALGQELFGFIPYELLPHLRWLAEPEYTHVSYVDLKPKVTDARIFTPDADHPNGWGTILIGGMRFGGSCANCSSVKGAPPMKVSIDGTDRVFYSAYFVLDITNPESPDYPKLLFSFSHPDLGLTTSLPSVLRVNPSTQSKTDNSQAKWYLVAGSGPTGYDGSSSQTGKLFVVDLEGPTVPGNFVTVFATADAKAFMGDVVTLDGDLDYRAEATYVGNAINNGSNPAWVGKLYRLTTNRGEPNPCTWGIGSACTRQPTVLLSRFPAGGSTKVGPITAAPTVTLDDASQAWLFFGTGRYFSTVDKTNIDVQHFFGVKDPVVTGGCTQTTVTDCEQPDLVDVSGATICLVCSAGTDQVTGVAGVTVFDGTGTNSLVGLVQSKDGWVTTLPLPGERALNSPTILGGTIFFTTFQPSNDVCASTGQGFLYALFYKTGSAYKESVIGTDAVGANTNVRRSMDLGAGLPSQMAIQIGGQGSGASGTTSGTGCAGRVTGFVQTSTGALNQMCGKPAQSSWSRYVSWINQRW